MCGVHALASPWKARSLSSMCQNCTYILRCNSNVASSTHPSLTLLTSQEVVVTN